VCVWGGGGGGGGGGLVKDIKAPPTKKVGGGAPLLTLAQLFVFSYFISTISFVCMPDMLMQLTTVF
jgi:hypothetical protein